MKFNLMNLEALKKYLPRFSFFCLFLFSYFVSCGKESIIDNHKQIKISELFKEQTYGDNATAYTNDSLFCIYINDNFFKVWKNGTLMKRSDNVLPLIKGNDSIKALKAFKFQSELMNLDFNNFIEFQKKYNNTINWTTKDYQIRKNSKEYFLDVKGYEKYKLPIKQSNDMDWITFRSMDINNDKSPELFIFHEYYNSSGDQEYGNFYVYEIKK